MSALYRGFSISTEYDDGIPHYVVPALGVSASSLGEVMDAVDRYERERECDEEADLRRQS